MSEPLKSKIIFDEPTSEDTSLDLASKLTFAEQSAFLPEANANPQADLDSDLTQTLLSKPKRRNGFFKGLLVAGAAMIGWQTVDQVITAYQTADWLSLGWSAIIATIAVAGIGALGREFFYLRRLKTRQTEREAAQQLLDSNGMGAGKAFCIKLAQHSHIHSDNSGYDRWVNALDATHNDQEVLELYDRLVISQQDNVARQLVAKYSRDAAVMVALSPLAIADMLLVAWRNLRLLEEIARVYGMELGYWSRIKLFKLVLMNMALAGASEVVADVGMEMLSMDLAGRMSTRVAQGVGVGLLTGRLGLQAMHLMRPLPWLSGEKPKLSEIRKDLLSQLTDKKTQG